MKDPTNSILLRK